MGSPAASPGIAELQLYLGLQPKQSRSETRLWIILLFFVSGTNCGGPPRMSFVRAFVRWGCCTTSVASLAVPAFAADKKPKEAATPEGTPSYYRAQPATENIDLTIY